MSTLPRSAPEAQGLPSSAIAAFVQAAEADSLGLHSFMLLRHGSVVAEGWWAPYAAARPHMLFSLSKSFTSTAIGIAAAEGRLRLDDPVISFFPASAPARPSKHLAAMQVCHLLSMSTGHAKDTTGRMTARPDGDWVFGFLRQTVAHEPGTHFVYNTGATYMLSAILQRVTGQTLLAYLGPRLFEPLGIAHPTWESCPSGVNTGGFGLSITTEDIARFGQLYLQGGVWQGQQLVPAEWIAQATSTQIANGSSPVSDWEQGYGYQFWRCRHGAYRGDGAFGQFCVVMPEQDAVLAITAGTANMQAVLELVWQHLLPAAGPAPLPSDPAASAALQAQLTHLALPPVDGDATGAGAEIWGDRGFAFSSQRRLLHAVRLSFGPEQTVCTLRDAGGEHQIIGGHGRWVESFTSWDPIYPMRSVHVAQQPIAASGAWLGPRAYQLQIIFTETPCIATCTYRFAAAGVKVKLRMNVSFGPTESPWLTGQLAAPPM